MTEKYKLEPVINYKLTTGQLKYQFQWVGTSYMIIIMYLNISLL